MNELNIPRRVIDQFLSHLDLSNVTFDGIHFHAKYNGVDVRSTDFIAWRQS